MITQHLLDAKRFYSILDDLECRIDGKRLLKDCNGRMGWPRRGVYFFFEPGELRSVCGEGLRVVRVGTHALKTNGQTTLWQRLSTHQGTIRGHNPGGGNNRASVFRQHIGYALIQRDTWRGALAETWGVGNSAPKEVRESEYLLEKAVSNHICNMPFLWVAVDDEPGPESQRGCIEQNSIALLSRLDPPSSIWLGCWSPNEAIRSSGLWNVNHVNEPYDPAFLDLLDKLVCDM